MINNAGGMLHDQQFLRRHHGTYPWAAFELERYVVASRVPHKVWASFGDGGSCNDGTLLGKALFSALIFEATWQGKTRPMPGYGPYSISRDRGDIKTATLLATHAKYWGEV